MKKQNRIQEADWGYVPVDPEPDFSAEKNRQVIDSVIREAERTKRGKQKDFDRRLGERTQATAQYLKSLQGGNTSNSEKYYGKRYLTHLVGKEKIEQLKSYAQKEKQGQEKKVQTLKP